MTTGDPGWLFSLERGFHLDQPQAGGWGGAICRSPVQLPPAERGFCDSGCYLNRFGIARIR